MITVEQARAELREMRGTMLWAFAHGHGCSMGAKDERERALLARAADLEAIIEEHTDV